ncbi:MAG: sugar phosphate isomerase/epimerase [Lachnospiraceae bacterium]|nr:sugar phosphate isomerase/epimerase [Lachnospiraceae bacterium]
MKISVFFDHILQAQEQTGKSLEMLLQGVRDAGIEAVEIRLAYLVEHGEVLDALKQADLKVSCIYEFYEMEHANESEKARRHIETAVQTGAGRVLVVPGFLKGFEAKRMQRKMPNAREIEHFMSHNKKILRMKEGLSYIAKVGQEKGVIVTVEDFDDKNSPLSGMHGIHWFLKQIPQLQYTLDTGNYLFYGEGVSEAFELLKDRITHVHCKDRQEGDNASVAVGTGYIPFKEILRRLKAMDYEGYLAIEHFDVEDQEDCMRKSAAFLKGDAV